MDIPFGTINTRVKLALDKENASCRRKDLRIKMNEQIEELLAVYVLGGLTPEEEAEVEATIAQNPLAAKLLEEAYAAAALLPYTAQPLEPSAGQQAALFARIEANRTPQAAPIAAAKARLHPSQPFGTTCANFSACRW